MRPVSKIVESRGVKLKSQQLKDAEVRVRTPNCNDQKWRNPASWHLAFRVLMPVRTDAVAAAAASAAIMKTTILYQLAVAVVVVAMGVVLHCRRLAEYQRLTRGSGFARRLKVASHCWRYPHQPNYMEDPQFSPSHSNQCLHAGCKLAAEQE